MRLLPETGIADEAPEASSRPAAAVVTLGEHLARVGAGAPCFACGAGLVWRAAGHGSSAALSCPRCGAEIEVFDREIPDAGPPVAPARAVAARAVAGGV